MGTAAEEKTDGAADVKPVSKKTEKEWKQLAAEAKEDAKDKLFYASILSKAEKNEHAYAGLLKEEKASDRDAKKIEGKTATMLNQFYGPDVGKGEKKGEKSTDEDTDLGEGAGPSDEAPSSKQAPDNEVAELRMELAES